MSSVISSEATGWRQDCTHQVEHPATTGYINGPCAAHGRTYSAAQRKQTQILAEMSPPRPCLVLNGETSL